MLLPTSPRVAHIQQGFVRIEFRRARLHAELALRATNAIRNDYFLLSNATKGLLQLLDGRRFDYVSEAGLLAVGSLIITSKGCSTTSLRASTPL